MTAEVSETRFNAQQMKLSITCAQGNYTLEYGMAVRSCQDSQDSTFYAKMACSRTLPLGETDQPECKDADDYQGKHTTVNRGDDSLRS